MAISESRSLFTFLAQTLDTSGAAGLIKSHSSHTAADQRLFFSFFQQRRHFRRDIFQFFRLPVSLCRRRALRRDVPCRCAAAALLLSTPAFSRFSDSARFGQCVSAWRSPIFPIHLLPVEFSARNRENPPRTRSDVREGVDRQSAFKGARGGRRAHACSQICMGFFFNEFWSARVRLKSLTGKAKAKVTRRHSGHVRLMNCEVELPELCWLRVGF